MAGTHETDSTDTCSGARCTKTWPTDTQSRFDTPCNLPRSEEWRRMPLFLWMNARGWYFLSPAHSSVGDVEGTWLCCARRGIGSDSLIHVCNQVPSESMYAFILIANSCGLHINSSCTVPTFSQFQLSRVSSCRSFRRSLIDAPLKDAD